MMDGQSQGSQGHQVRGEPAMTLGESFSSKLPPTLWRHGHAVSSVAIALGFSLFLSHHKIEGVEFSVFLIAIAVNSLVRRVGVELQVRGECVRREARRLPRICQCDQGAGCLLGDYQ
jgi:hypothetical protein